MTGTIKDGMFHIIALTIKECIWGSRASLPVFLLPAFLPACMCIFLNVCTSHLSCKCKYHTLVQKWHMAILGVSLRGKCRFPEIGVPPNHLLVTGFSRIFPYKPSIKGTPIYGTPQVMYFRYHFPLRGQRAQGEREGGAVDQHAAQRKPRLARRRWFGNECSRW